MSSALTLRHALLTAGLSVCSYNLHCAWPQLSWDPHSRASGQSCPGRNDTEHHNWHMNEDGRGISESTNHFPSMQQTFGQYFLLPKGRSFDGCMRNAGCLALKIQPKELQRCTWGLEAMAVPIHTQSKSRDKYESEKEKLWNFVQVLSTFTHVEKLYLSKPSHWLHMWARIACMKKGHWNWSLHKHIVM